MTSEDIVGTRKMGWGEGLNLNYGRNSRKKSLTKGKSRKWGRKEGREKRDVSNKPNLRGGWQTGGGGEIPL